MGGDAVATAGNKTTTFYLYWKWNEHFCVSVSASSSSIPTSFRMALDLAFNTFLDLTMPSLHQNPYEDPCFFLNRETQQFFF